VEISKYARGLPALLDLKERGTGPHQFSDQVVGVVDLTQLYLLQNRQTIQSDPVAVPAVGSNQFAAPGDFVVPAGEMWYVWEYSVTAEPGAAEAAAVAALAALDDTASVVVSPYVSAAANEQVRTHLNRPLWLSPGGVLGVSAALITGAPVLTGQAVVTKLKI